MTDPKILNLLQDAGLQISDGPLSILTDVGTPARGWRKRGRTIMIEQKTISNFGLRILNFFGAVLVCMIAVAAQGVDDARVVSADLPAAMPCGGTYPASVTMQNTGTTTWTHSDGNGYKLGAVDDSDPFYPLTRVYLPADARIDPGQSHRFTMTLTAPAIPGTYLTDWRMVHEGVRWFGEIAARWVEVNCGTEATICPGVTADLSGRTPAAAALQQCVDATPDFGVLEIPPGAYLMDRQVLINRPITLRTAGTADSGDHCAASNMRCATLRAAPDLYVRLGFLAVQNTREVVLDHIALDGNRAARLSSEAAGLCRTLSDTRYGYNLSVHGCTNCWFTYSLTENTLCGTGLEWTGHGAVIYGSVFRNNGQNSVRNMWADGLTLLNSNDSVVTDNLFLDNSDIGFVCGGARNGFFSNNTIRQQAQVSFGGLMLDNFNASQPGDFTDALVLENTVDCTDQRCHFGINLGPHAWYLSRNITGGTVAYNTVRNARQGLNIDGAGTADNPIIVFGNDVSGSPDQASFQCGTRPTSDFNINVADSVVDLHGDTTPYTTRVWHRCP